MIKEIIHLLQQKNKQLSLFEKLSSQEHDRLLVGNFNHIQKFYKARQQLLQSIEQIDQKLKTQKIHHPSKEDKNKVLKLLQIKKKIVLSILHKDLMIYSQLNEKEILPTKEQAAS